MKRLIIVGAGVVGSSAKRIAQEMGWETLLCDSNPRRAASHAALATIRPQWLGDNGKQIAERSWRWYEKWGATVTRTAMVSSYSSPVVKEQSDWWLVDPQRVVLPPDVICEVDHCWSEHGRAFANINGKTEEANAILFGTGAHDKRFVWGFKEQHGATLLHDDITLERPLYVHHLRPYHSLTVGYVNGTVRLGSSVANTEAKAVSEVWSMLSIAEERGIVPKREGWRLVTNVRAKAAQPLIPRTASRHAAIGNLGRSGYGYAPYLVSAWLGTLL